MRRIRTRISASPIMSVIPPRHTEADHTPLITAMQSVVVKEPLALEIVGTPERRHFLIRAGQWPSLLHAEAQLRARYAQAGFASVEPDDDPLQLRPDEEIAVVELKAGTPSYLSLQTWEARDTVPGNDPILGILAALDALPANTRAIAQLTLAPAPANWSKTYQRKAIEHALEPERAQNTLTARNGQGPRGGLLIVGALALVGLLLFRRYQQSVPPWLMPALAQVLHGTMPHLTPAQRLPFLGVLALPVVGFLLFVLIDQLRRRLFARPLYDMKLVGQKTSRMAYRVRLRLYVIGPKASYGSQHFRWKRLFKKRRLLNRLVRATRSAQQQAEHTSLRSIVSHQCDRWPRRTGLIFVWAQIRLTFRVLMHETTKTSTHLWRHWRTVKRLHHERQQILGRLVAAYRQFHLASGSYFVLHRLTAYTARRCIARWSRGVTRSSHLISVESLADLWHLPPSSALPELALIEQRRARTLLLPPALAHVAHEPGTTIIGSSVHGGHTLPFAFPAECLDTHLLIAGKSGEGKSTCMGHLARTAMNQGGLVVIDPHGDLVDHLLHLIPEHRIEDVVLIDLSNRDESLGLNPLDATMGRGRDKSVADLLKTLAYIWASSWGPRMENAFEFALRTLYEANKYLIEHDELTGASRQYTLLDVMFVLTNESYCHALLEHIEDPFIQRWWQIYYDPLSLTMQRDRIDPVLSKVAKFESQIARRIIGQSQSTINFAQYIQDEKIILVKLAKGVVGEDVARLLGATFLNLLQIALEEQGAIAEGERKRLPIMIDEFQTLKGVDWSALAELRKYGAAFYLATQSLEYLRDPLEPLLPIVLANVRQYVMFHLSAQDAETIHQEIGVEQEDIVNLESHMCYVKLTYAHHRQPPFSLHIAPPVATAGQDEHVRLIHEQNRRYMRPAASIDGELKEHMIRAVALQPKEDASSNTIQEQGQEEPRGLARQQGGNRGRKSREKRDGKDKRTTVQRGQTQPMNWTETVGIVPRRSTALSSEEQETKQSEEIEDGQNA